MNKKASLILGGMRIGDTFHTIPLLNELTKEGFTEIHWHHGEYEKIAVDLLCNFYNIKSYIYGDDNIPTDLNSRKNFLNRVKNKIDYNKYDKVIDDINCSFDINGKNYSYLDMCKMCKEKKEDKYIVFHGSSISNWKQIESMYNLKLPYKVYTIGLKNDKLFPNSKDARNIPFIDVVKLLKNCNLFIGIHSAFACLSFYIENVNALIFHFGKDLLKFSIYNKRFKDILPCDINTMQNYVDLFFKRFVKVEMNNDINSNIKDIKEKNNGIFNYVSFNLKDNIIIDYDFHYFKEASKYSYVYDVTSSEYFKDNENIMI